jgi:GTP-binding nuclear protein Ran
MFDTTMRITYKNVPNWHREVMEVCESIPAVLVGNKVDNVATRQVKPKMILFHRKKKMAYVDMSVKQNYNIEKPMLNLIRALYSDQTISFVNLPSYLESQVAPGSMAETEAEFNMDETAEASSEDSI